MDKQPGRGGRGRGSGGRGGGGNAGGGSGSHGGDQSSSSSRGRGRGRGRGNGASNDFAKAIEPLADEFPSLQSLPLQSYSSMSAMTSYSKITTTTEETIYETDFLSLQQTTHSSISSSAKAIIQPATSKKEENIQQPETSPTSQTSSQQQASSLKSLEESFSSAEISPGKVKTLGSEFPQKPVERGNLGRLIRLKTNHYNIKMNQPLIVYQYDVEVTKLYGKEKQEKVITTRNVMKQMFPLLVKQLSPIYKNKIVYNFSKNLFSLVKMPFEQSITYELEIENEKHFVTIKKINEVEVDPLKNDDQGADFFNIGFGLELWKGAYTSVRPSEVGLTWNVDSANSAFLISVNLLDAAANFYKCDYHEIENEMKRDKDGKEIGASFIREMKGRDIKTSTGGYRKKIQGLGPNAFYKFDLNLPNGGKQQLTIQDYLKRQYNIDVKFPYLPCADLGKGNFLPMELCKTELKHQKKLDEKQTAEVIKITAVKATDRLRYIENWAQHSEINKDPVLREYKIDVSLKITELDGRVLEPPDIEYNKCKIPKNKIGESGQWDHRNLKFNISCEIKRWVVINYSRRIRNLDPINQFIDKLISIGRIHGINVADPLDVIDSANRANQEDAFRTFDDIIKKHKSLDLYVVILPGTSRVYNAVKTCGDIKYGIATQGVEDRNVNRINDQTISNILLKINTKLGGRNFIISKQTDLFAKYLQGFFQIPIMIMGADVTHPNPGDSSVSESIAAVVASFDKDCCQYGARLYAQKSPRGQAYEMIHDLDKMVISFLQEFYKKYKTYPKIILFYRDGVSEGQFSLVLRHEMNKIRQACQSVHQSYKPAISFIVVQKRHHTRLFPVNQQDKKGKSENVPAGTVVDKVIVSKYMYDFFLCSHAGIQGTSRPCRYFVLHDDNNFRMNQIQLLSYYLCHIYSRCPRSVSYPAPAYYSHLAAFRGRDYIRALPPPLNTQK